MNPMSVDSKFPDLMIHEDEVSGSVNVTGTFDPDNEDSVTEVVDGAIERGDEIVVVLLKRLSAAGAKKGESRQSDPEAEALRQLATAVSRALKRKQSMTDLIDQLSPPLQMPSRAAVLQAYRNAEARTRLLEEYGFLSASEVADRARSTAANRSALAGRWRKEGQIFAVPYKSGIYFPLFQFGEEGKPLPLIGEVLEVFKGAPMTDWQTGLWFVTRNGWLGDRRPVELFHSDPDAVTEAARQEVAPIAG